MMALVRNEETNRKLKKWLEQPTITNLLLVGKKGSGKFSTVKEILSDLYQTSDPFSRSNVYLIQPEDGRIGKDKIHGMIEMSRYISTEPKLFVIDDADLMGNEAQNALLKLLEDKEDTHPVILVAHHPLIPTIVSRCTTIPFGTPSQEEAEAVIGTINPTLWKASEGTIGVYQMLMESKDFENLCVRVHKAVFCGTKADVLKAFGCMKEKDKEMLLEAWSRNEVDALFAFLKESFMEVLEGTEKPGAICTGPGFLRDVVHYLELSRTMNRAKRFQASELMSLLIKINDGKGE